MSTITAPETVPATSPSAKEQFLNAFEQEYATTMRLLRAYPRAQLDLKPAPTLKSARELAWMFALENGVCEAALTGTLKLPPSPPPSVPDSWDAELGAIEATHARVATLVRELPDAELHETFRFYVAPRTEGDVPKLTFLWMMLCDSIHHRGQLTVYTRMAGGVVPSIYGPTLEEPWF